MTFFETSDFLSSCLGGTLSLKTKSSSVQIYNLKFLHRSLPWFLKPQYLKTTIFKTVYCNRVYALFLKRYIVNENLYYGKFI